MKRLISVFTIFIALFVFYDSYTQFSLIEEEQINNIPKTIADNEGKKAFLVSFTIPENRKDFLDDLISFIHQQDNTATICISEQDKDMIDYEKYYLFTKQSEVSLKNIYLDNNQRLDFQKNSPNYYSSDLSDDCYNHLLFLNRNQNKPYNGITQFYAFDQIRNDEVSYEYYLYFISNDAKTLVETIKTSSINKYLSPGWELVDNSSLELSKFDSSLLSILMIICIITMFLLTICNILNKQKEVMIRKLNGMNSIYIVIKLYGKQFILSIGCYLITLVISYMIFIGKFYDGVADFIKIQLLYFLIFFGLQLLMMIGIYILTCFVRNIGYLKKPAYLKAVSYTNIILKIGVLLLSIQPLIEFSQQGVREGINLYNIIKYQESLQKQLYVHGISPNEEDFMMIENKIKAYFQRHGGIYQDFITGKEVDNNTLVYEKPYVIVNNNYLKDYQIKAEDGTFINVDNIKQETLLIPLQYKNQNISISDYCEDSDGEIIYIQNGVQLINHDPLTATSYGWKIINPIIDVRVEIERWSYPYMFLSYDDRTFKEIKNDFQAMGLGDSVQFNTTSKMYDTVFEQIKDQCLSSLFVLSLYIITILVFLYQNIYIYFIEHKVSFAINYIYGYSFRQRHGKMLLSHIMIYLIPLIVGWFILHIDLISLLIFVGCGILFEIIAMFVLTKHFEKKKMVEILKGE